MTIRLKQEDDPSDFFGQMEALCGRDFHRCFQCSSCSGSCPMTVHMDASPRKVMHLLQFGLVERLKSLNTYWICASCLSCQVVCPRNIDVPRVMEALRLLTLRSRTDHLAPSRERVSSVGSFPQIALIGAFRKLAG